MKKKIALLLSVVMIFGVTVGATLAWLKDTTTEVKNTFTVGKIGITLTETWNTDTNKDGTKDSWYAQLIPGKVYTKDPVVRVDDTETNVDCYLFVKFEENNNPTTYLDYESTLNTENGWTKLAGVDGVDNVWYREVKTTASKKEWNLLDEDKVTVKSTLEEGGMPKEGQLPELVYTAYAIQSSSLTDATGDGTVDVKDAWQLVTTTSE